MNPPIGARRIDTYRDRREGSIRQGNQCFVKKVCIYLNPKNVPTTVYKGLQKTPAMRTSNRGWLARQGTGGRFGWIFSVGMYGWGLLGLSRIEDALAAASFESRLAFLDVMLSKLLK